MENSRGSTGDQRGREGGGGGEGGGGRWKWKGGGNSSHSLMPSALEASVRQPVGDACIITHANALEDLE